MSFSVICPELLAAINSAVCCRELESCTNSVKLALESCINAGSISLPENARKPCADHYARRMLYRCPKRGYTIIGMVWGPGQATPLHDHSGTWCVEGVLEGQIEITQFALLEEKNERFHFKIAETVKAGVGEAGRLIPPFEYHTIKNRTSSPAITLHVYGKEIVDCTVFSEVSPEWYIPKTKTLGYDS